MKKRVQPIGAKNIIGQQVRDIRLQKGIKQKELSFRMYQEGINLNTSTLSKIEGQLRAVSDRELVAFSQVLDVPVEELFAENPGA